MGNSLKGIFIQSSQDNRIGGTTGTTPGGSCTGACNVISGNGEAGINIESFTSNPAIQNIIEGNFIGTDVTGTSRVPNAQGIRTFNIASSTRIGGPTVAARNVISGNNNDGIAILGNGSQFSVIQGNFIGTNSAGTARLGNNSGIRFVTSTQNITIGGTTAGTGNVISGNSLAGIYGRVDGGTIQGNFIGTDLTGTLNLGNGHGNPNLSAMGGISLLNGAINTAVGGTVAGAGNVIAFNYGAGVRLGAINSTAAAGAGNPIRGNAIYLNDGVGISLKDGTNYIRTSLANDTGDADTGPNNRQNYPVLTSASQANGIVTVAGSLNSVANTTFAIEFFMSPEGDPSGNGEGDSHAGVENVTTDGSGNATFSVTLPYLAGRPIVTATATNTSTNDTSEFSSGIVFANAGNFIFSSGTYEVEESTPGFATITVERVNGSLGAVSVDYATSHGTADSGDYTAAAGTLNFADGETSKTFTVTIFDDSLGEPRETINLSLGNPTNGAALGRQSAAVLTILEDEPLQTFVVNSTADPGDGVCDATECTLREGIVAANSTSDLDAITFNLGSGTPTITLASALPEITARVVIDGETGGATRVEVNGHGLGVSGFLLRPGANRSVLRKLVINRFGGSGIYLATSDDNVIEGNFLGTNSDGDRQTAKQRWRRAVRPVEL